MTALAAQDDGSTVASGSEDGLVCISNLHTGRILGQLTGTYLVLVLVLIPTLKIGEMGSMHTILHDCIRA